MLLAGGSATKDVCITGVCDLEVVAQTILLPEDLWLRQDVSLPDWYPPLRTDIKVHQIQSHALIWISVCVCCTFSYNTLPLKPLYFQNAKGLIR